MNVTPDEAKGDLAVSITSAGFRDGAMATSTPLAGVSNSLQTGDSSKSDVSKMFAQMGSKLGWFQFSDLDSALKTLSKSTKKKSARPRRPREESHTDQSCEKDKKEKNTSTQRLKKHSRKQNISETQTKKPHKNNNHDGYGSGKENSGIPRHDLLRNRDLPLREKDVQDNEDRKKCDSGIPLRPSKACLDLTKSPSTDTKHWQKKDRRNALSLKKKKGKKDEINITEESRRGKDKHRLESVSPDYDDRESDMENKDIRIHSSSESPEDFGIPIRESTRIFSESGLGCGLDSINMSRISLSQCDSVSGLSSVNNSNDDSYKQLNIYAKKNPIPLIDASGDVCLRMKSLHLAGGDQSNEQNPNKTDSCGPELYVTAINESLNNTSKTDYKSSEVEQTDNIRTKNKTNKREQKLQNHTSKKNMKISTSSSSSSFSLHEVIDAATQIDSDLEQHIHSEHVRGDNSCPSIRREDLKSNNVSDTNLDELNVSGCNKLASGDSSGSLYEVEDVSLQTSATQGKEFSSSTDNQDTKPSYSLVEVQDISIQTEEHKETISATDFVNIFKSEEDKTKPKELSEKHIPTSFVDNDDDIIVLDPVAETRKFNKRDPSIYFDAKDLSSERMDFKYKKRDPSVYFDAKQTLSDSSKSPESTSNSHVNMATIDEIDSSSHDQNNLDDSVVVIEDDCNHSCHSNHSLDICESNGKTSKQQMDSQRAFELLYDDSSDDEIKDYTEQKDIAVGSRVSLSGEDSPSSPANLRARLLKQKRQQEQTQQGINSRQHRDSSSGPEEVSSSHWRTKKPVNLDSSSEDDLESLFQKLKSPAPSKGKGKPKVLNRKKKPVDLDSSSEDDLESFFQKMKGHSRSKSPSTSKAKKTAETHISLNEFIVEDDDVSSDSDDLGFYLSSSSSKPTKHSERNLSPIKFRDVDSEDEVFKTPASTRKIKKKSASQKTENFDQVYKYKTPEYTYSFLKSLSENIPEHKCDATALRYVKTFKKSKEDLTRRLFRLYNETVFDCELPDNLEIIWNKRLLRTAGYCAYKRTTSHQSARSVRIELSTKVCDSAERVRDTLIHELCHAAVWLLNGKTDGHGPYWKYWARKSNLAHPEIPVIGRCHNYSINTKYTYQCSKCGYRIGRHSKSLNTEKKVCGYCHGTFILLQNQGRVNGDNTPKTPRTPNKFALFVKENYGEIKQREKLPHKDVMKILSQEFAAKNKM